VKKIWARYVRIYMKGTAEVSEWREFWS
jgi:hypothetical protein